MSNFWLKVRIWTKVTVFALALIYVLIFVGMNTGDPVEVWLWFGVRPALSILWLLLITFVAGVVVTLLARAVWRTVHQIRELRRRSHVEQLERENAALKAEPASAAPKAAPPAQDQQTV